MLAIHAGTVLTALFSILFVLLLILIALYFLGRRMQKKQEEQQPLIEANTMDVSILVIDKKKMRIADAVRAGLPEQVRAQTPFYLKLSKLPIVKAKVGPRVMTFIAEPKVFELLPLKKEVKVAASGLYIRSIKSVRGGAVSEPPAKKGFFSGLRERIASGQK